MYSSDMAETGLRERSKARRRAAIIRAAYELFAERGYDATTVADIAEAAEVSPRTIAMYFPAKQDIAMSRVNDAVASLTAAMDARPPGETVADVLRRWLLATQTEPADLEQRRLARRMFAANPQLAALRTARLADAMRGGAAVIAADTNREPGAIAPRLVAAAASAMIAEVLDTEPGADREEAIAAAMRFIGAGMAAL
jgi:AcrR family transcriptional regulator